jgi:hypothetical protein
MHHFMGDQHQQSRNNFYLPPPTFYFPPSNSAMNYNHHHFMGQHHHHQQQPRNNFYLPPPTFSLPPPSTTNFSSFGNGSGGAPMPPATPSMMPSPANTSPPAYITLQNDGTVKEESPREVFFRTLSTSLKEANKFYSGKTTTWKNPFLYKTTLCENYCARSYCRYGVNCWYAHGVHELRCIPESDELPDPAFIAQYLSFLGLPKQALEDIINHAYHTATLFTELKWYMAARKSSSSELQSFGSTRSASSSNSPTKDLPKADQQPPQPFQVLQDQQQQATSPASSNPITIPKPTTISDAFCSSVASNGGNEWNSLCSAINGLGGLFDENTFKGPDSFGKSFRLFGESYPLKPTGNA